MPTKAQLAAELARVRARNEELEAEPARVVVEELQADPDDDDQIDEDLELFFQETDDGGPEKCVDGYRYEEDSNDSHYVHRWPLDRFSLPAVSDEFGGGKWSFRLRYTKGGKFISSKTVRIEGAAKKKGGVSPENDPRSIADKILDQHAATMEKVAEIKAGPPAELQAANPMAMALTMFQTMETVLKPQRELMNQLIANMGNGGGDGGGGFSEMFKVFQMGMEMGKDSAPQGSDPMGQVLAHTLPPLLQVIGDNAKNTPDPATMLDNPPAPTAAPTPPVPDNRPGWDFLVSAQLPTLLKWARDGAEVSLRAAFVVDELPAEAHEILLTQLRRGQEFFREFMMLHPEAQPWENWFAAFWLAVADQFEWGSDEMGPHPFQDVIDAADAAQEQPEGGGVEVGTHTTQGG